MFEGIYAPIITPFKKNEEIDFEKLEHNLDRWGKSSLAGILVLGSNGEFPHLSPAEKMELVRYSRANLDRSKKVLAGTTCDTTKDTVELSEKVSDLGADAVLVLPPYYYKGLMTEEVLLSHFTEVADRSPLPVMIYNMPANTGINLSASLVCKLSEHENVVGIKDSSGNIVQIAEIVRSAICGFLVFAGSASFMLPAFAVGARGATVALANIMPEECCRVLELFNRGRMEEARELQLRLLEINHTVTRGWGIPALKAAMDILGYHGGEPRRPLRPLSEEKRAILREILLKAGAL
jgi:4-hydroxy-2-oxoglutarate aldolase